jgi:hypothetical protein
MKRIYLFIFMVTLITGLKAQVDWKKIKSSDGITVWTKDVPGTEVKQFRAKVSMKEKITRIVSALSDVESMHLWYGRVKSVKTLERISDNEGIYLLEYGLPFPFKNRFSTIRGKMIYGADKKSARLETAYTDYNHAKVKDKGPLITQIRSLWELQEEKDGTVTVVHEGFLNPGGNVPVWAINNDVVDSPLKSLKALRQLLAVKR